MTRSELLILMHTERERVWTAIAGLTQAAMTQPPNEDGWSVKDILAHLAFWEEDATQRLELIATNRADKIRHYGSDEEIDETNAEVYHKRRNWTPEEAIQALRKARERMLEALEAILDEHLSSTPSGIAVIDWIVADTFQHDQEHLPQIPALKQRLELPPT